jgi:hypothetical protein
LGFEQQDPRRDRNVEALDRFTQRNVHVLVGRLQPLARNACCLSADD